MGKGTSKPVPNLMRDYAWRTHVSGLGKAGIRTFHFIYAARRWNIKDEDFEPSLFLATVTTQDEQGGRIFYVKRNKKGKRVSKDKWRLSAKHESKQAITLHEIDTIEFKDAVHINCVGKHQVKVPVTHDQISALNSDVYGARAKIVAKC